MKSLFRYEGRQYIGNCMYDWICREYPEDTASINKMANFRMIMRLLKKTVNQHHSGKYRRKKRGFGKERCIQVDFELMK